MYYAIYSVVAGENWVGKATPCTTILQSAERVRSVTIKSSSCDIYYENFYKMQDLLQNYYEINFLKFYCDFTGKT